MPSPYPDYPHINDPARPTWHFGPPAQWMNDPNGIIHHEGWWHAFYQHNPGGDQWGDMHWGHARSRDLIHWEHLPIALRPQLAENEFHCYSGCCVLNAKGELRILYTSVPPDGSRVFNQVIATPYDNDYLAWTQHVAQPVLNLATHDGPNFAGSWRDPYVFQAEGRTFLILGANLGEEATVPIYENLDGELREWTYRGILMRKPLAETQFFECPSLIQVDGQWVLFDAPCREMEWHVGTLDLENYQFHAKQSGHLDESKSCYASQAKIGPDGRALVFNWIRHFPENQGWNGCLGVIRRLWIDKNDSRLCSAPIDEITELQAEIISYPSSLLTPNTHELEMPGEAASHGELNLELSDNAVLQIELCGVTVMIDHRGVRFNDCPVSALLPSQRIHFRWLLDRSLLEVFVNDRAAYTAVCPYPTSNALTLRATRASAQLVTGHAWRMRGSPSKPYAPASCV